MTYNANETIAFIFLPRNNGVAIDFGALGYGAGAAIDGTHGNTKAWFDVVIEDGAATPNYVTDVTGLPLKHVPLFRNAITFTVTAANATVGATYTNNSVTFTVLATIAGSTTLIMSSSVGTLPLTSGTLTKASGTGDATIAFSAYSTNANQVEYSCRKGILPAPLATTDYIATLWVDQTGDGSAGIGAPRMTDAKKFRIIIPPTYTIDLVPPYTP